MILKIAGSLLAGSLLGVWFLWQSERDEHLFQMYECAHASDKVQISLEEAYLQCEQAAR